MSDSSQKIEPPDGFSAYSSVLLCGNRLIDVAVIFKIGPNVPLWVGKGGQQRPKIWLSGSTQDGQWFELIRENTPVRRTAPAGGHVTVIADATQPQTLVMVGNNVLVHAIELGEDEVEIRSVDLRPCGLNIVGNDSGLMFGGNRFQRNVFRGLQVAFAVDFSASSQRPRSEAPAGSSNTIKR